MNTILLAGTHSGCGKTTVMLTLLQYFQQQSYQIQAFKAGPDFLDPLWHQAITGKSSYNLDTRMMGSDACRSQLLKHTVHGDAVVIEGVMGLFDGRSGVGEAGSSVDLARVLGVSVILVVDAKGMSGSIVPLVAGFCQYAQHKGVKITGIIANRVGSEHHAGLLRDLLTDNQQPPLMAWMEKGAPLLPERHLGLKRPEEVPVPDFVPFLHVQEKGLSSAFSKSEKPRMLAPKLEKLLMGKTVALAKDAACCFIYQANLDWLSEQGAITCFFSPLAGEVIPAQANAVWLPGGYPELYAEQLAVSETWTSLRRFIEAGKPVLAECGGMMLLGRGLVDFNAKFWPMANILPYLSRMQSRLVSLGYRELDSGLKGHEFHHSTREGDEGFSACFNVPRGDQGISYKNVRASYNHWYFPSAPAVVAEWFS